MRKVTLLLTTLLLWVAGTATVLADASDYYSTADNIVVVTATSSGRGALTASADSTYLHSASYTGLTMSTEDNASYLVFYPADEDNGYYYIYSVAAAKLLGTTGGALTDGTDDTSYPLMFYISNELYSGTSDTYYAIWETNGNRYNLGGSYQTTIDTWGSTWGSDDSGNQFTFEVIDADTDGIASTIEVILATIAENIAAAEELESALTLITSTDELTNSTIISLQTERGVAYYDGDNVLGSASSLGDDDATQQFVLYTTDDIDGYYLYSVAADAFVGVDTISVTPTVFGIGETSDDSYPWYLYTYSDGTDGYDEGTILWLNNNNAGSVCVDDWGTTTDDEWFSYYLDGGNMNRFVVITTDEEVEAAIEALLTASEEEEEEEETVDLTALQEALEALETAIATYPLGDALGEYNIPGYTTEEVEQSIALAEAYLALESGQTQELVDSIAEVINAGTAALTINQPTEGTYLRIKSYYTDYYISSDYSESVDYLAATVEDGTGDETILYFDGTYLQSYATGLYAASSTGSTLGIAFSAESTDDATDFIFRQYVGNSANGTPAGVYAIFYADSTYSLSVDGNNYATALTARTGGGKWLGFYLEEVTLETSDDSDDTTVEAQEAEALEGKIVASVGEAVSDIADFDGGTWYLFQVGGTGRTGYAHSYDGYYYNAAQGSVEGESTEMIASALFRVIPNEDGTYSLQDGEGNYLALDNSWSAAYTAAEGDEYTTFVIGNPDADTDASVWYLYEATATTILDTNAPTYNVSGWGQVDEDGTPTSTTGNNAMQFFPVVLEESDIETVELPTGYVVVGEATTDLQEGTWYYINNCPNGSRTGWIYSSDKTYYNAESAPDSVAADDVTAYLFRVVANEEEGTYGIVNGNGYYFSQYSGTIYSAPINTAWVISKIDEESDAAAYSALSYGTSYYLDTNGAGYTPAGWAGTPTVDGNECVYFVELTFVESLEEEEEEEEEESTEVSYKIASVGEAVSSTDAFDGETYYLFKIGGTGRTGYAYNYDGLYYNGGEGDVTAVGADAAATMLFKIVPNEDGTYSLVDGTGAYVALSGWSQPYAAAEGDDYTTFNIANPDAETDASVWYLQEATTSVILDTNAPGTTMAGWGTDAPTSTTGNNAMQFVPVTLEADETLTLPEAQYVYAGEAVTDLTEISEETWYYLYQAPYYSGCENYLSINPDESYVRSRYYAAESAPADGTLTEDAADYLFRFAANEDGTYSVINADGLAMSSYSYSYLYQDPVASAWTIEQIASEDGDTVVFSLTNSSGYNIDTYGTGVYACLWNDTPSLTNSNVFQFIAVSFEEEIETPRLDALLAAIEALEAYEIGDDLGQYSVSGMTADEIEELLAEAQALYESEDATVDGVEEMIASLTAAADAVAFNVPAAGTFLRIKSSPTWLEDQPYLGAYNSESKSGRAEFVESAEDDNEAATIFYYDGTYLINYETGYYLTNNSNFLGYNGVTTGSAVSFQAATYTDAGMYNVVFTGTSASRYLYTNASMYTDAGSSPAAYGYNFELEYVESLPVTTDESGYATLYTPVEVALADGATVYEVTLDGDVLAKTQVDAETIGGGSAVLIEGEASTTYNFTITTAEGDAVEGDLTGAVATVSSVDYAYTLGYVDEAVAFVLDEGEIKGFEAYLVVTDSEEESYLFDDEDEEETGIAGAEVAADAADAQTYDLQGRAVSKTLKGGIYIINGKKVYVK